MIDKTEKSFSLLLSHFLLAHENLLNKSAKDMINFITTASQKRRRRRKRRREK
jgi:hypothetical protein